MGEQERIKGLMKKFGIYANKNLGQNFLISDSVLEDIIVSADIDENTNVLEIGPGLGGLTCRLVKIVKKLVAIEIDNKMIDVLKDEPGESHNLSIINADILKTDIDKIINEEFNGENVVVIANLPYYITTPIITKLITESKKTDRLIVMVQKEVADRICGSPDGKDYGAITLLIDYLCDKKLLFDVESNSFLPPPNVMSSVIRLDICKEKRVPVRDERLMFRIIKAAFGQRRKTLVNALSGGGIAAKDEITDILNKLGINKMIRGEALTIEDFAKIADRIKQ